MIYKFLKLINMFISKIYNKNKINIYIENNIPYFQENQIKKILKIKKSNINNLVKEDKILEICKNNKKFKLWFIDLIETFKSSRSIRTDWNNIP